MGRIHLEGMQFKSNIGVYSFEQQYGNNFEVDVIVESDIVTGEFDQLDKTLDYDVIYQKVKVIMQLQCNLIEYAANQIVEAIKIIDGIHYICVRIAKLHPPLGSEVKKVTAELKWSSSNFD